MSQTAAPDWYPDPFGRHEHRYFDGAEWTEHVASHGQTRTDPPTGAPRNVPGTSSTDRITAQVADHEAQSRRRGAPSTEPAFAGDGTLFGEPVLVVNQKAKLIEIHSEYAIHDRAGTQIGAVRQVGQSTAKKIMRAVTSVDQFMTHTFQVVDVGGAVVAQLTRPAKLVKSRVVVADASGADVGEVVQEKVFGRISFGLHADGTRVGSIDAENWRAWNFAIRDASGEEVARITKTFEGVAKTLFTTADDYVVQIHRRLDPPLREMVVCAALCVDTALKQDDRGLN